MNDLAHDAVVDPFARVFGSTLGARTRVWQGASVIRGARVGADCTIGANAIVDGSHLGDRCAIGAGAQVHPGARLGHDVFVGPGAILCNDRWPRVNKTGFDIAWLLDGGVVVEVKDGGSIGAGAIVLPGVVLGEHAMVAAGAVVDRSVPAMHLFKRCGAIVPIDERGNQRIRPAA